ncbi:MAG: ABC transporter permease, partial [Bacillota bacterium]|nr:ABC transporter permease [Bacillota bacterium]
GLFYTPHPANQMSIADRLSPPSSKYVLGTDQFGRDILSRIIVGARHTLVVCVLATIMGLLLGVFLGAVAGYYGGLFDELVLRLADSMHAFPALLLALLLIAVLGSSKSTVLLAIGIANIPIFTRLIRGIFIKLRETDFVLAARALGASDWRIMFIHMLPNSLTTLIVQATSSFAAAVLAEASLSYLGLGIQPPDPSWGRMLREAQSSFTVAPWVALFPGLAISLTVLGLNLLGEGILARWNSNRHYI